MSIAITHTKQSRKKKTKKQTKKGHLRPVGQYQMVYGRYISYIFGRSEERTGQKKICEEIMFENFPKLITDIKLKNQEARGLPWWYSD